MEVVRREKVGNPAEFRVRQKRAQDLLRGPDLEDAALEKYVTERVMTTTLDRALNWARANSMFPATFGLACCAIEMMAIVASRVDSARIGSEAFRATPRQADLMIISGRVSIKMAPIVRRVYDQMLEPKWAIAMGACSSSMGVFNNYAIVPADKFMPVDVHVPGCPPRPEALMHGIFKLRQKIMNDPAEGWRERYEADRHRGDRAQGRRPRPPCSTATPPRTRTPQVPDATGLELLAADLRDAAPRRGARHGVLPRTRPRCTSRRQRSGRRSSSCAGAASRSWPPCTASTTTPRSRASACSTSCST